MSAVAALRTAAFSASPSPIATPAPNQRISAPPTPQTRNQKPDSPTQPQTATSPSPIPQLLADYLSPALTFIEVAQRHSMGIDNLAAWAASPDTQRTLAVIRAAEEARAAHIIAVTQCAAIEAMVRALDATSKETSRRAATTLLRIGARTNDLSAGRCSPGVTPTRAAAPRAAETPSNSNQLRRPAEAPAPEHATPQSQIPNPKSQIPAPASDRNTRSHETRRGPGRVAGADRLPVGDGRGGPQPPGV